MLKKYKIMLFLLFLFSLFSIELVDALSTKELEGKIITIDPGHGGIG